MRCARHPYEGGVGVCAPCLRDRLLALAAAQNAASSLPPPLPPPEPPEPEPVFPRSVSSPYVCRRKSDASSAPRGRPPGSLLFFRTPQVGPAYGAGSGAAAGFEDGDIGLFRRRRGRFSVLATLFGHTPDDDRQGGKERRHRPSSWLAAIVPRARRRRRKDGEASALPPPSPPRRSCRGISDRGLSPVRYYADGDGEESTSPAESPWWLPSPSPMRKTPCRRRLGLGLGAPGAGVSGFSVCISPLVRPSLGRHLRGGHPPDAIVAGELRPSPLHPLTSSASLHHCRSWKLADGGRFR
ncbi:uncharacterized protein LOC8060456 [Sorghum bicolor]|uniref:Uncharacterized protein n=1 Tax=Sorghum bicolor TaxID=4558 RepID=C5YEP0_SORBI|nr:uncharacterized protein LOC8060456 [Sorghum bicolor]EES12746.1 hypothetical protein SORBI_3006G195400 [Sorghum bicolor]|eukprot:XP_002448418.1 uncharacterized protein LOC8060456 [Sorghum bicolor]